MANPNHISRRSERLRTSLRVRCRTEEGSEGGVTLVNVSPEGCCFELNEIEVQPGQSIAVKLAHGGSLPGMIRWVENGQAGVEFDMVLPASVVRYLRMEHSNFMEETPGFDFSAKRFLA